MAERRKGKGTHKNGKAVGGQYTACDRADDPPLSDPPTLAMLTRHDEDAFRDLLEDAATDGGVDIHLVERDYWMCPGGTGCATLSAGQPLKSVPLPGRLAVRRSPRVWSRRGRRRGGAPDWRCGLRTPPRGSAFATPVPLAHHKEAHRDSPLTAARLSLRDTGRVPLLLTQASRLWLAEQELPAAGRGFWQRPSAVGGVAVALPWLRLLPTSAISCSASASSAAAPGRFMNSSWNSDAGRRPRLRRLRRSRTRTRDQRRTRA